MTNKLYYEDTYTKTFTAKVVKQGIDGGKRFVVLDQTAFYPTGGGQPHDTGLINDIEVTNVEDLDDEIRHYIATPLEEGEEVFGQINWARRFDHMQQHAGQHILSAAFEELFGFKTVSFHLGKNICTIDLEIDSLLDEQIREVEQLCSRIILENRKMETKWVTAKEAERYPLRKKLSVTENVRLVIIPNFDYNGCGGTHPNTTGQVMAIKVLDWERQRKKARVVFVCGKRVVEKLDQKQKIINQLTKTFHTPEQSLPVVTQQLLESAKQNEKLLNEAKDSLLAYEAKHLLATHSADNRLGATFKNRTMKELQKLAQLIVSEQDSIIVTLINENDDKLQVVVARGNTRNESMNRLIKEVLPLINGKGGGNDAIAQGGGEVSLSGQQLLERIEELF